jgi:formylmethanofuran dehydrogenase subunit B
LFKIKEMNLTIEIEKKEDYPFIKKLLESLKGVKIVPNEYEMIEGVPAHVFEEIEKYTDKLKTEDLISEEDFLKFINEERCRLQQAK